MAFVISIPIPIPIPMPRFQCRGLQMALLSQYSEISTNQFVLIFDAKVALILVMWISCSFFNKCQECILRPDVYVKWQVLHYGNSVKIVKKWCSHKNHETFM